MIYRLLIALAFIIYLSFHMFGSGEGAKKDSGCVIMACGRGYANSCVGKSEEPDPAGTACVESAEDICYKQHGTCAKTQGACGWEMTPDLKQCLNLVRTALKLKASRNPEDTAQHYMDGTPTPDVPIEEWNKK